MQLCHCVDWHHIDRKQQSYTINWDIWESYCFQHVLITFILLLLFLALPQYFNISAALYDSICILWVESVLSASLFDLLNGIIVAKAQSYEIRDSKCCQGLMWRVIRSYRLWPPQMGEKWTSLKNPISRKRVFKLGWVKICSYVTSSIAFFLCCLSTCSKWFPPTLFLFFRHVIHSPSPEWFSETSTELWRYLLIELIVMATQSEEV